MGILKVCCVSPPLLMPSFCYILTPSRTDIAKDANIDLVVCSVRVDRHLETIAPSLKAGKDVYVEWPLGKSAAEAREILRLQKEGGGKRAIVGLQGREAPSVKKLKEVIESGRIGKVLSSTWAAQGSHLGPTGLEAFAYMGDKPVGGNIVTIHFGHAIDYIQTVLGYGFSSSSALLANRRTTWDVSQNNGSVVPKPLTADDTIFLHGTLAKGEVPLSATLRGGPVFPGTPGLDWRIYGEKGEVRLSAGGPFLQIGYEDIKIEVFDFASGKAEVVEVADDEEALALPARSELTLFFVLWHDGLIGYRCDTRI